MRRACRREPRRGVDQHRQQGDLAAGREEHDAGRHDHLPRLRLGLREGLGRDQPDDREGLVQRSGQWPWTYTINWDDNAPNSTGSATPAPNTFQATHPFNSPGVYTINVCVKDSAGASGCAQVWIVVYDASAGFVTGGGWIDVQAGSYRTNPALSGRANFGFNSKYKAGASTPDRFD
jgi:hypothetical protein